jgi:hypothetical protein
MDLPAQDAHESKIPRLRIYKISQRNLRYIQHLGE